MLFRSINGCELTKTELCFHYFITEMNKLRNSRCLEGRRAILNSCNVPICMQERKHAIMIYILGIISHNSKLIISSRSKLYLLSPFYKIVKSLASKYLSKLLPKLSSERLRSRETFSQFPCRTSRLQKFFWRLEFSGSRYSKLCISSHFRR